MADQKLPILTPDQPEGNVAFSTRVDPADALKAFDDLPAPPPPDEGPIGGVGASFPREKKNGTKPAATPFDAAAETDPFQGRPANVMEALHDPTPLDQADPQSDLIRRLAEGILAPQRGLPQPRPFTTGEHIALGIIGALDPDAFKNVVMPMLEQEREQPVKSALYAEQQRQTQIKSLEALASLMGVQEQRRATQSFERARIEETAAGQKLKLNLFNQSEKDKIDRLYLAAKLRGQASKVPEMVATNYALMTPALSNLTQAKKLMDDNKGFLGGEVGGPISSEFTVGPGAAIRAQVSSLLSQANDIILKLSQRRGVAGGEGLLKITDSLPEIGMSGPRLRASVETALNTLTTIKQMHEKLYPQLLGMMGGPGGTVPLDPNSLYPGFEAGDSDLGLILDDSAVP